MNNSQRLFVYGTLRPQAARASHSTFPHVGTATAQGTMYDISWFPGVVFGGDTKVIGDVLEVTPSELRSLDRYEGYDSSRPDSPHNLYKRVKIRATMVETGKEVECWAYQYNRDTVNLSVIPDGNFLNSRIER